MEEAHAGKPGKTCWLVAEVEAYRAELTFDFRHLFQARLADIGEAIPWDEAVALVEQLAEHPGSHYWSKLHGFTRATDWAEISAMLTAQRVINFTNDRNAEPIKLPIPIRDPDDNSDVTPERRDELVEYARATAPFPLDD